MKIHRSHWLVFIILSFVSLVVWFAFSYPQLAFLNLSVDRKEAQRVSRDYLVSRGYDISDYSAATVFKVDHAANRYLQKAIGFQAMRGFIEEHDMDLFYWATRFFREYAKEEFRVVVSSATGEVIGFSHTIKDNAARKIISREEAKKRAVKFLGENFGFDKDGYTLKGDLLTTRDNRKDYFFSWKKKGIQIPWNEKEGSGTAKLITSVTVSGDEILRFSVNNLDIPDEFGRYLSRNKVVGHNISTVVQIFVLILFIASIYFIYVRRNHIAMQTTKRFYIGVAVFSFLLTVAANANLFERILFGYPTTSTMDSYLWRYSIGLIKGTLFIVIAILMPSLSGELLHHETSRKRKAGSFLYYVRSTFFSRAVASQILLGYAVFMIMLGIQALAIEVGQRYMGVWVEHSWITQLTSAYIPFLAAFTLGFKASFSEEVMYRLFAINWGKKLFKNTAVAVIASSLIWGFAHSTYPVYPMWFRGIEVTLLGFFLGFVYVRFGLIAVLIAHYLFDVFWNSAGHLLGETQFLFFFSALTVMLLPLIVGTICFIMNRKHNEREMRWRLNKHQRFNSEILKDYLAKHWDKHRERPEDELISEIVDHGWDVAVVEEVLRELKSSSS